MNCLYLVKDEPISRNYSGGAASIYIDHLLSLQRTGCKITLLHYATPGKRKEFREFYKANPSDWEQIKAACTEIIELEYEGGNSLPFRIKNRLYKAANKFKVPLDITFKNVFDRINLLVKNGKVDFIYAQHFHPATIAVNFPDTPSVFVHHDWLYRIKALRFNKPEDASQRKKEEEICKLVTAAVSCSYSEFLDIYKLGAKKSFYIPVNYEAPVNVLESELPAIVHLGGMNTTANRIGLENFLDRAWPQMDFPPERFVVIGKLEGASEKLAERIKKLNWMGFVQDLSQVLKKGDIHIVPWDQNTGTRTRVPLALSYGQVVVAVAESVKCLPELKDGYNCLLVFKVEDMKPAIEKLLNDPDLRKQLSQNAMDTFNKFYTQEHLQLRFNSVLTALKQ